MSILSQLEPQSVYRFFEEMTAIPRGSINTKAISDYAAAFARERNLQYRQDETNNVVIFKPATPGYENAPTVMLQGHMDMVCEKDPDCKKDMETEGLDIFTDGKEVGAIGTTLGGDDGIAIAMCMAILDADDIPHPALECVFTVDEEVGMAGAKALDTSDLKSKYLINLDSEAEKIFTVSCAGSSRIVSTFTGSREANSGRVMRLVLDGLKGGHSGEEIHKCRGNSNILLGRALNAVANVSDMRIITVKGGAKDNAIPRDAEAIITTDDAYSAARAVDELNAKLKSEYRTADGDVRLVLEPAESDILPFDAKTTQNITTFLFCVPNGVMMMSADVDGLVQTSTNLGNVYTEGDSVVMRFMTRSSVNSQRDETNEKIVALTKSLGGTAEIPVTSGAWEYMADSPLRDMMVESYRYVYGEDPVIAALHAGLECGVLADKMPGLDCISIGPTLTDIHTPRERMHVDSVERTWRLVLETLKRLK